MSGSSSRPPSLGAATLVTAGASALAQGVQLASLILAARRFGPEAFGTLGFVSATAATAAAVTAFAPALHVARRYSLGHPGGLARATGEALALGAVATAGLAGAHVIGLLPLLAPVPVVVALALLLAATGAHLIGAHALIGAERFRALGAARVAGALVAAAGVLAGAARDDVVGAIAGLAAGQGVSALVAALAVRHVAPRPDGDAEQPPSQARGAALAAAVLGGPMLWVAQAIVAGRDDGAAQMGHIAAVAPLAAAVLFVPSQLGQAWFAALARAADVRATLARALRVTALLGGGSALVLAATSPWWGTLFGARFAGIPPVAVPLLLAAGVQGTVAPAVRVLEARGHVRDTVWLNALLAAVVVGGTAAVPRWGASGYAHAVAAGFAAHAAALALVVRRRMAGTP